MKKEKINIDKLITDVLPPYEWVMIRHNLEELEKTPTKYKEFELFINSDKTGLGRFLCQPLNVINFFIATKNIKTKNIDNFKLSNMIEESSKGFFDCKEAFAINYYRNVKNVETIDDLTLQYFDFAKLADDLLNSEYVSSNGFYFNIQIIKNYLKMQSN